MSVYLSPALALTENVPGNDLNAGIIGWDNVVTISNISADSAAANYPASNMANPSTASQWRSGGTATQYVTIDYAGGADWMGIARHNLSGMTVSIEASIDEAWEEIFPEQVIGPNRPLILRFAETGAAGYRLKIQGATVPPRIAVFYLGMLTVLHQRIYVPHTPIPYGRESDVQSGRSESGNYLGRVVLQERLSTDVALQNIPPAWYRSELDPFVAAANQDAPFFFNWRPMDYPDETGFCWLRSNARPQNQRPNGMMQLNLALGGVAL